MPDGFARVRYADPAAPKGGRLVHGVLGTFDSLNPLIVRGHRAAADPRLRGREPDGARLRRAVHALWADRPLGRNRCGAQLRHLHARSRRALLRRQAGDARGRDLLVAAAARQGPAESPHLLRQGGQGRGGRRARGPLRSRRQRRSRAAAHSRPDAGARQARRQAGDVRGDVVRGAARERPVRGRRGRSGQERDAQAQPRLLGARPSDQPRLLEFRRDQVRLLPRRQFASRSVQARPLRCAHRARSDALADRLRFPRAA